MIDLFYDEDLFQNYILKPKKISPSIQELLDAQHCERLPKDGLLFSQAEYISDFVRKHISSPVGGLHVAIIQAFNLGYMKGGRAAIAGTFKEPPPRRRKIIEDKNE